MRRRSGTLAGGVALGLLLVGGPARAVNGGPTLIGWNNLGMHCMDPDYAVFAILPPYNTVNAQLVDASGRLVTATTGVTVTYEAVADPSGSINSTSQGKTNFWFFAPALFGANLAPDVGLAGHSMPGLANLPQSFLFDASRAWFIAEGIPITPWDDAGVKNPYPLMRLVARGATGTVLATTSVVLPVSDEMDCRACHATASNSLARPVSGWVNGPDPISDYRLNILRLHDERRGTSPSYAAALAAAGYNAGGLYATAAVDARPVLCASCHASEALAAGGIAGIPPLTSAVHWLHAAVTDPANGSTLDAASNRDACYRCHPGSATRCLRGAMGRAVNGDGSLAIHCQSCHGTMTAVGAPGRRGWLEEPTCQSCHTGTASSNNGQIRYASAFEPSGQVRVAVNQTFATNANTPAAGLSLYRFSRGHGGLSCPACHNSTHAEAPSSHGNDNLQNESVQGHSGVLGECDACHNRQPATSSDGPHGMHPAGQGWVSGHEGPGGNEAQCTPCHGTDYRGTVLSRSFANRALSAFGTKQFWRGFQIGCYTCHSGPNSESGNSNRAPVVANAVALTGAGKPVQIHLVASDPDGNAMVLRIVSQPAHGTAGVAGTTATYIPDAGFSGADSFAFAARDGATDSNLARVDVTVQNLARRRLPRR